MTASYPRPSRRVVVAAGGGVVHYPWPQYPDEPHPLCGVPGTGRFTPAAPGERLCHKCRDKGRVQFGWSAE